MFCNLELQRETNMYARVMHVFSSLNIYSINTFHVPQQCSIIINTYFSSLSFVTLPNEYLSSYTLNVTTCDYFLTPCLSVIFEPRTSRLRNLIHCILIHFQEPIHTNILKTIFEMLPYKQQ